jgi:hypothetical protein
MILGSGITFFGNSFKGTVSRKFDIIYWYRWIAKNILHSFDCVIYKKNYHRFRVEFRIFKILW